MKNKRLKKFSTIVLSLLMAVSMMPSMAFAESLPDGADSDGIIYPTVNYTDVAPFLDPVEGASPRAYARSMARTMSIAPQATDSATDRGMNISKTATANDDGSYTIQLEAYSTGSKVISEVTEEVPTDIVLVLDQSGSMKENMNTYSFREYTNQTNSNYYNHRHNGSNNPNLYYKLSDDSYAPVSVSIRTGEYGYNRIPSGTYSNKNYYYNRDKLFALVNGKYVKVTVKRSSYNPRTYTYTLANDTVIGTSQGNDENPTFDNIDGEELYLYSAQNIYTYTYTDENDDTQTIGTSTGANNQPEGFVLYERYITSTTTRLEALKSAVTTFADNVAEKAKGQDKTLGTTDDVNHRIAVVGFATGNYTSNSDYPKYENTELFIGATQYNYNDNASNYYSSAFQNMNTQTGYNNVIASKNALAARGATYTNYGLKMANGIFEANPVTSGEKRNRVVIVFTDGTPGYSGYDSDVAQNAITEGTTAKEQYKATVYTVGIFAGADATSAGKKDGNDTEKANWFMQNLSSNNGTVQTPSYYLSAADSNALNNIFQQISNQIESGGSSTTLSGETVIKDIISPQFTLPAGADAKDITLETYLCTGVDSNGAYTWQKNPGTMGATATVDGDQVRVSKFDFAANYVGTVTGNDTVSYRGNKLVISFNVRPKGEFLGGNNVYTNESAGVYENSSAKDPVLTFERPQVNVPIEDVTVAATDKNVYLLGSLTGTQLKSGATAKVGDVELKLDKENENFGLETWQTEYVDITIEIKDKDGNKVVSDLSGLDDDQIYTVSVQVSPKTEGANASGTAASAETGSRTANINVFKPVVTFKDSEVYYGEDAPKSYDVNTVSTVWEHGDGDNVVSDLSVSMTGTAPDLKFSYEPRPGVGKINTKNDIPVDVTTSIGDTDVSGHTTYVHKDCGEGKTCDLPEGKEFLLHVKTCQLSITKEGGIDGEPYVFNIMKEIAAGKYSLYTTISITGNESETISELPVGTYKIAEDTNWSWRYGAPEIIVNSEPTTTCDLSSTNPTVSFTVINRIEEQGWLNDFSTVVQNVYGPGQSEQANPMQ